MYAKLLLTRYDVRRRTWCRSGNPVYFEGEHGSAVARVLGDSWCGEGSNERRNYTVLTETKPFDREPK
jgi:hypothetical protein